MNKGSKEDNGKVAYRGKNEVKHKEGWRNTHRHKAKYNHNQSSINQQKGKKVYIAIFKRVKKAFSKEYNLKYSGKNRINKNKRKIPKCHLLTTILLFSFASAIED